MLQFNTALKDLKIAAETNFIIRKFSAHAMMEIVREYMISQFFKKIEFLYLTGM